MCVFVNVPSFQASPTRNSKPVALVEYENLVPENKPHDENNNKHKNCISEDEQANNNKKTTDKSAAVRCVHNVNPWALNRAGHEAREYSRRHKQSLVENYYCHKRCYRSFMTPITIAIFHPDRRCGATAQNATNMPLPQRRIQSMSALLRQSRLLARRSIGPKPSSTRTSSHTCSSAATSLVICQNRKIKYMSLGPHS